jgi:cytochrome d ubiquinol oxidase subunit II
MALNIIWFLLLAVIVAGYLILDGFDLGVGILHPFVGRTDEERRISLNSIGPVWDGNEVWLVLAGGVLFGVFPFVYASLFSGFYAAFMLVLLVLILRTVAIEFRSKRASRGWRRIWDAIFFLASAGIALLLGVAFGNIIQGVNLNQSGDITGTIVDLLNPFALLVGLTTIFMVATHGAIYLSMKVDGEQLARVKRWIPRLIIIFFVLNTLLVAVLVFQRSQITERYLQQPALILFPLGALIAAIAGWFMVRRERYFTAFVCSAVMIFLLLLSAGIGLYPNLLISTLNPQYNLTIFNAASESQSLIVMLIVAVIGIPVVLLYTIGVYYFFRGRVKLGSHSY